MVQAENTRISWIDMMKFVCILFVMVSHLESGNALPEALYSPFFLTGFLFAAGYVHRQENFSVFLRKKVRTLLLPWFLFSVGNLLLSQIFTFQAHGSFWEEFKWNLLQIRGQGDGVWFVAALFVSFLPFDYLIRLQENIRCPGKAGYLLGTTWFLSLLSLLYNQWMDPALLPWNSPALPWHLEFVPRAVFFMTVGWFCRQKQARFPLWWLLAYSLTVAASYGIPALRESHAAGIAGVFSLAALCQKIPESRFVSVIGQNTLLCFALHGKVMSALEWTLGWFEWYAFVLENRLLSSLLAVGMSLLMALLLMVPIGIINRWFPFLLGRKRRK